MGRPVTNDDQTSARHGESITKHGKIIGENCRALGFNVDFAPVLDLAFAASRNVMGSRAVSANPDQTVEYVREFLAGLADCRVLGCGKHFPGLGEGKLDSHHHLPVIEKSFKDLWAEDLLPYRMLKRQLPFVMVSHAAYPKVTKAKLPASLSRMWITDILRKRIGYKNLIVSDDLEMEGVLSAAPIGEAALVGRTPPPRSKEGTHPGRVSCVRNTGTPTESGPSVDVPVGRS